MPCTRSGCRSAASEQPSCSLPGDSDGVERVTRIELALSAWEADVLPLNYTRWPVQPDRNVTPTGRRRPAPTCYRISVQGHAAFPSEPGLPGRAPRLRVDPVSCQ